MCILRYEGILLGRLPAGLGEKKLKYYYVFLLALGNRDNCSAFFLIALTNINVKERVYIFHSTVYRVDTRKIVDSFSLFYY